MIIIIIILIIIIIDIDSDRIQPHNLYTNPNTNDPREQEKWQGLYGIKTVVISAFHANPKKRKSDATTTANSSDVPVEDGEREEVKKMKQST